MKISIRTLLTVPFLLQLFTVVGIVGWLSFRNGQEAVNTVVDKLREETSERVYQRVQLYLATPHLANQLNAQAFESGALNLGNSEELEQYFWNQLKAFHAVGGTGRNEVANELNDSVNNIYIGTEGGELYGAEHHVDSQQLAIMRANASTGNQLRLYKVDAQGTVTDQEVRIASGNLYDPRRRPWYREAQVISGDAAWSSIYGDYSSGKAGITAVYPIYEQGELLGVLASDLLFAEIQEFLNDLGISEKGEAFILDQNGCILTASDLPDVGRSQPPIVGQNQAPNPCEQGEDQPTLLRAGSSGNPLIDQVPDCLRQPLSQIGATTAFECEVNERYFLQVAPLSDDYGLNWLIFVAIPESDFMGQIYDNNWKTLGLCMIALAIATGVGLVTARWISQPILLLKESARSLSESVGGELPSIEISNPSELEILADTFSVMANRLKQSFDKQERLNVSYRRFVPREFVEILRRDITEVELGDNVEQDKMSILFADIRSFTTLSEGMTAEDNFAFINAYLSRMEPLIAEQHGFIDKYIGDAIMALFGGSADDAVQAGIKMLETLAQYNQTRTTKDRKPIRIGIGINTGKLMLGTIGGRNRMDGTVISDEVNLASRLEGLTKRYGVSLLISEQTLQALQDREHYHYRFLGSVKVKGRMQVVDVYEIFDGDSQEILEQKSAGKATFEQAIRLYQSQDFLPAKTHFQEALRYYPDDQAALFYIERCAFYQQQELPDDWIGVEEFVEK